MPVEIDLVTRKHLERVVETLAAEFDGVFTRETIGRTVDESAVRLGGEARFADFLPVLAHRFARERLLATAQAHGLIEKAVPEVLFVCVQNAGRSQFAAALLDHHARGRVSVRTAGSAPAAALHSGVVEALTELGIDVREAYPKPLTDEVVRAADVVITMGCGDACPFYAGKRYEDWDLADPEGQSLDTVRAIRDDVDARVQALLAELVPDDRHQSVTSA
jgi:arsenate reductase (thioredoxin)